MAETRKPGGGRKPSKPEYSAEWNLTQQMDAATALYKENYSLQSIADALSLNPIKVRKLLITAGIYESDIAKMVQRTFNNYKESQSYKDAVLSTASVLKLSKASVTSYLPYENGGVLFKGNTRGENQCGSRAAAEIQSGKKTANRADRGASVGSGPALFWSAVQNLFRLTLYL